MGYKEKKGFYLDLSKEEKEAFLKASALSGISQLSTWMRITLRKAAKEELTEVGLEVPFLPKKSKERVTEEQIADM